MLLNRDLKHVSFVPVFQEICEVLTYSTCTKRRRIKFCTYMLYKSYISTSTYSVNKLGRKDKKV
jgi:hypothetical protein